jgi:hypothetical protein
MKTSENQENQGRILYYKLLGKGIKLWWRGGHWCRK